MADKLKPNSDRCVFHCLVAQYIMLLGNQSNHKAIISHQLINTVFRNCWGNTKHNSNTWLQPQIKVQVTALQAAKTGEYLAKQTFNVVI